MDLQLLAKKNIEYDKLVDSLVDLKEIQDHIAELLQQQDEKIENIEENFYKTDNNIIQGLENLKEAKTLRFNYKNVILGGVLGGLIGGPIGLLTGMKYIGLTTTTGTIIGGIGGYFG